MSEYIFNCPHCSTRCTGKVDWYQHSISHLNPAISLSYVRIYKLMITSQKIFCPVENCDKTFTGQNQALWHLTKNHDL